MLKLSAAARRTWLAILGMTALILAGPAWRSWRVYRSIEAARRSLASFDPLAAVRALEPLEPLGRADVHYWLAVAARRANLYRLYGDQLERASALGWPQEDIQRQRFLAQAQMGGMDLIEPALPNVLPENATDEATDEICEALVNGYLHDFRVSLALNWLERWSQLRPQLAEPWVILGEIRAGIIVAGSEYELAEKAFLKALTIDPGHRRAKLLLCDGWLSAGRLIKAAEGYRDVLARYPADTGAAVGLAQCLNGLGESAAARELCLYCLELPLSKGQQAVVAVELGKLDLEAGNLDQAIARFNESTALAPLDHRSRYKLMQCLTRAGRTAEAEEQLRLVQRYDEVNVRNGELRKQMIQEPDNLNLLHEMCDLATEAGDPAAGRQWLLELLRRDRTNRRAHERLAEYYEKIGDDEHAEIHRNLLRSLTPVPTSAGAAGEDSSSPRFQRQDSPDAQSSAAASDAFASPGR